MIYDSFTVKSKCFSAASHEMLPLNVHYAEEPLLGEFTNSIWAKKPVTVAFLWTLCCPAEHTPALRWQDIDISGHKAAHQISSSPEQPPSQSNSKTPRKPWTSDSQHFRSTICSREAQEHLPTGQHLMALSHMKNCSEVLRTISWKFIILHAPAGGTWFNFSCQ